MGLPTDVFSFISNPLAAAINGVSNNVAVNKQNQANLDVANATNEAAIKINQDNIALQQQENYKNRVFNDAQADLAFQRQVKMQQMQNQWNSPIELAQRYAQAGINPNVAFGNGTMQSASPSVGSSPSASYNTGLSPSLPNLSTPRMEAAPSIASGVIDSLSKIANIDKILAESKHQKEQAEQLRTTRDLIIKNLQEDANGKSIANELQQQYGALLHESKIQEQMTSAMKNIGAFNEALANADYQRANKELAEATKNLRQAESKTQGEQYRSLKLANDNFLPMLNAKIKQLNASANKANEEADAQRFDNMQTFDAMQQGVNKYIDEHYNIHADILLKRENRALAHQFINKAVSETIGRQLSNQEQAIINSATPELLANNIELVRSQWRKNDSDTERNLYEMQREAVQMTIQSLVGMLIGLKGFGGNFHIKGFAQ